MTARSSGFSLLELMVVVAIISIVSAMAASTAREIGARNATQSAASDLSSILQSARARAEQRGSDVYVIFYPTATRSPTWSLTGGSGAVFVYEDTNGDFITGTGACTGLGTADCSWSNFSPPNDIRGPTTSADRLVEEIYLEDYAKANVKFGKPSTVIFPLPFLSVAALANANGCSFCTSGNKGAVVFTGEQQLRFLDDAGLPLAQRVAGLSLQGVDNPYNTFLFGLVGATGLVTTVK